MLGIRRYQGWAIDLWQGNAQRFVCDETLSDIVDISSFLSAFIKKDLRHLNILVNKSWSSQNAMSSLKSALQDNESDPKHARRITFCVGDDATSYENYREALSKTFAEGWG